MYHGVLSNHYGSFENNSFVKLWVSSPLSSSRYMIVRCIYIPHLSPLCKILRILRIFQKTEITSFLILLVVTSVEDLHKELFV